MIHFRTFRNDDPPALAALWNRGAPELGAARPLSGTDFDLQVTAKPHFESAGLIVAERDGQLVGFAHAGFGPSDPIGPAHHLCYELGTIAMLVVAPGPEDRELEHGLIREAERYLRSRGAMVLYAGGQLPLNPFYWGIYGGSECAGILSGHSAFRRAVVQAGYESVSTTVLLEADLSQPEVRDPRAPLIRRQVRVEVTEDVMPGNWWEALAIGAYLPTRFQLRSKADDAVVARATTWDMTAFGRHDGRARIGLIDLEVDPSHRRKGYARYLIKEIMRQARDEMIAVVDVQTHSTNEPALALYNSLGFTPVETTSLYRLPDSRDLSREANSPDS